MATKEEVKSLRTRFEEELAKQSAKAVKATAKAAASTSSPGKHGRAKKRSQSQQYQRAPVGSSGDQMAQFLEPYAHAPGAVSKPTTGGSVPNNYAPPTTGLPLPPVRPVKGKKKKRSALANASNPHHLRNYVPSRVPGSGPQPNANTNNLSSLLSPHPLRFLSAEIPSSRRRKSSQQQQAAAAAAGQSPSNPNDEWICAFCEYDLFYSEEQSIYKRAVRKRKKILKRRQRARERAAAAAAGKGPAGPRKQDPTDDRDGEQSDEYDDEGDDDAQSSFGDRDRGNLKRGNGVGEGDGYG